MQLTSDKLNPVVPSKKFNIFKYWLSWHKFWKELTNLLHFSENSGYLSLTYPRLSVFDKMNLEINQIVRTQQICGTNMMLFH